MSLSEIIKNLTEENELLREDNKRIREQQAQNMNTKEENELHAIIQNYQKKAKEMTAKIKDLEDKLNETKSEIYGSVDKSRYKALARKLKEERNMYRDKLEETNSQQKELKMEMDKMTFLIGDLKEQCKNLQHQIDENQINTTERETQVELDKDFSLVSLKNSREDPVTIRNSIPPQCSYSRPGTVLVEEKPKKVYKDAEVQYNEEELRNGEKCISEFENYSSCSSLTEEFKFASPRFSESALLIEEEQDRQEAIEEIQASLISDCYRKHAADAMEKDNKLEMKSGCSIPWSLASKNFASRLQSEETDDDQDVICTF